MITYEGIKRNYYYNLHHSWCIIWNHVNSEILNDLGMNNHPIYTNHYVDGLIGMIVFFLIFGLFINKVTRLLKEAEIWIMQRSAVEILFATLGLVVGLFISVMASFILEMIGNSILNHLVPIIITLLLCYLGFQFGLKKRDEMLMFCQKI